MNDFRINPAIVAFLSKANRANPPLLGNSKVESSVDQRLTGVAGAALTKEADASKPMDSYLSTVIPTLHCADTQEWRKRIIRAASHQIIISGNYCGGKSFDEILELIASRMERIPKLQVLILGHPQFIQDKVEDADGYLNCQSLGLLKLRFPDRFLFIECPDTFHSKDKSINHAKLTLIDYGAYVLIGGSGIKDNFAMTGLDDLTVEEFLEEEDRTMLFPERKKETKAKKDSPQPLPGNFRDQDFVFHCHDPRQRKQLYRQALWLANLWYYYHQVSPSSVPSVSADLKEVEAGGFLPETEKTPIVAPDRTNVLMKMLQHPFPEKFHELVIPDFASSARKVQGVKVDFFFAGKYNQGPNRFTERLMQGIETAKREIIIDHMHFHPPKKMMTALRAAVKRGVKVTVITNGVTKNCPSSHKEFGPKNLSYYAALLHDLTDQEKNRVKFYLFEQHKKGIHKKIVLIDQEQLYAGSSNLESKCLEKMGDNEVDFVASSCSLAEQTLKIIRVDIEHSHLVNPSSLNSQPAKY